MWIDTQRVYIVKSASIYVEMRGKGWVCGVLRHSSIDILMSYEHSLTTMIFILVAVRLEKLRKAVYTSSYMIVLQAIYIYN